MEALLKRLIEHNVDFVLVGGYAVVAHGASLVTQDLDVCFKFSPENLTRLDQSLEGLHPVHRMTPQRLPLDLPAQASPLLKNLYLSTDLGPLDCLGNIKGLGDYDAVKSESEELELPWGVMHILTLPALIRAKKAMNRPRDLEAVKELTVIRNKQLGGAQSA